MKPHWIVLATLALLFGAAGMATALDVADVDGAAARGVSASSSVNLQASDTMLAIALGAGEDRNETEDQNATATDSSAPADFDTYFDDPFFQGEQPSTAPGSDPMLADGDAFFGASFA